jgi:hypothetical protein
MIRCDRPSLITALALAALLASTVAEAQMTRNFDAQTLRGELVVSQPPEVLLNEQPARLAPGSRIRGANNLLLLSGQIVGQRLLVHYTLDINGQILNVWVLTPAEATRRPWPVTIKQAQTWQFDVGQQTWSPR